MFTCSCGSVLNLDKIPPAWNGRHCPNCGAALDHAAVEAFPAGHYAGQGGAEAFRKTMHAELDELHKANGLQEEGGRFNAFAEPVAVPETP